MNRKNSVRGPEHHAAVISRYGNKNRGDVPDRRARLGLFTILKDSSRRDRRARLPMWKACLRRLTWRACLRIFAGVDEVPVGREPFDRRMLMPRRDDDAVLEAHAPDVERRKQHRLSITFASSARPEPQSSNAVSFYFYASAFSAALPAYFAWLPSSCSIRSNWLYLAVRSERANEPVLI
jgi:hypothetical protein